MAVWVFADTVADLQLMGDGSLARSSTASSNGRWGGFIAKKMWVGGHKEQREGLEWRYMKA